MAQNLIILNLKSYYPPTGRFKMVDPKEFDLNEYASNRSKSCFLEVDLEYPEEANEQCTSCTSS